jgi:putative salt-induced outer membrane protein YdiY
MERLLLSRGEVLSTLFKTNIFKILVAIFSIFTSFDLLAIGFDIRSEINKVAKDGYSGSVKFTTENKWGNTLSSAYWIQAVARYRAGRHTTIGVLKVDNEQEGTEAFSGNSLGQLLYRYNMSDFYDVETNLTDYRDEFRGFSKRLSAAVGPRFRMIVTKETEFFLGLSLMYESQKLLADNRYPGQSEYDNSTRLVVSESFSHEFSENMNFTTSMVFQVNLAELADIRFVPTVGIKIPLNKYFSYFLQANYIYESEPPYDVVKYDLTIRQGLYLSFGA